MANFKMSLSSKTNQGDQELNKGQIVVGFKINFNKFIASMILAVRKTSMLNEPAPAIPFSQHPPPSSSRFYCATQHTDITQIHLILHQFLNPGQNSCCLGVMFGFSLGHKKFSHSRFLNPRFSDKRRGSGSIFKLRTQSAKNR